MIRRLQSVVSLITCFSVTCMASPTASSVGIVMTTGVVQVDGSPVPGTSAIFSGNLVAAGDRSSSIQFVDGTSAVMKPGAALTVYRERSVLRKGVTLQRGVDKHPVSADELKISGATPNAVVLVGVKDASHIEVAAQEGESDVWGPSGNLVAHVKPGQALSFALSQATSQTQSTSSGVCGDLEPNYQLTDVLTQVTYQLQGSGLDQYFGKSIRVTGTIQGAPSGSGPQILVVSSVKKLNHPCVNGPGAEPSVTGIRRGALVFLIFVAAGGVLLGIGTSGAFGPSPPPVTPAIP